MVDKLLIDPERVGDEELLRRLVVDLITPEYLDDWRSKAKLSCVSKSAWNVKSRSVVGSGGDE